MGFTFTTLLPNRRRASFKAVTHPATFFGVLWPNPDIMSSYRCERPSESGNATFSTETAQVLTITGSATSISMYINRISNPFALVPARVAPRHFSTTIGAMTLLVLRTGSNEQMDASGTFQLPNSIHLLVGRRC